MERHGLFFIISEQFKEILNDNKEFSAIKKFISIIIILPLLITFCVSQDKKNDFPGNRYYFSQSGINLKKSADAIDRGITYEVFFTLKNDIECATVEVDGNQIEETFPFHRIPLKTYFIVEKVINTEKYRSSGKYTFSPLARNFNNEWAIFTPVKICGIQGDPLSKLEASTYRIRFTTFEATKVLFIITVSSDAEVVFSQSI